jgi:hypothetical protein
MTAVQSHPVAALVVRVSTRRDDRLIDAVESRAAGPRAIVVGRGWRQSIEVQLATPPPGVTRRIELEGVLIGDGQAWRVCSRVRRDPGLPAEPPSKQRGLGPKEQRAHGCQRYAEPTGAPVSLDEPAVQDVPGTKQECAGERGGERAADEDRCAAAGTPGGPGDHEPPAEARRRGPGAAHRPARAGDSPPRIGLASLTGRPGPARSPLTGRPRRGPASARSPVPGAARGGSAGPRGSPGRSPPGSACGAGWFPRR